MVVVGGSWADSFANAFTGAFEDSYKISKEVEIEKLKDSEAKTQASLLLASGVDLRNRLGAAELYLSDKKRLKRRLDLTKISKRK